MVSVISSLLGWTGVPPPPPPSPSSFLTLCTASTASSQRELNVLKIPSYILPFFTITSHLEPTTAVRKWSIRELLYTPSNTGGDCEGVFTEFLFLPGVGLLELLPGTEEAIDPEVPLDVLRPPGPGWFCRRKDITSR